MTLPGAEVDRLLRLLTDRSVPALKHREAAKSFGERFLENGRFRIEPETLFVSQSQTIKINGIIKSATAIDVLETIVLLCASILEEPENRQALISGAVVDHVIELWTNNPEKRVRQSCLVFFDDLFVCGEEACKILLDDGNGAVFLYCVRSLKSPASPQELHRASCWVQACAKHANARHILTAVKVERMVYDHLLEMAKDYNVLHDPTIDKLLGILLCLTNDINTRQWLTQEAYHQTMTLLISKCKEKQIQRQAIHMYSKCLKESDQEHHLDPIPELFKRHCDYHEDMGVRLVCLKAMIHACTKPSFETRFPDICHMDWLIKSIHIGSHHLIEHLLLMLRNMTLLNHDVYCEFVDEIIKIVFRNMHSSCRLHALCILCNLTVNDHVSQKASLQGGSKLYATLVNIFADELLDLEVRRVALQCLRNLCIDQDACRKILYTAIPKIQQLIHRRDNPFRLETIQIVRNLIVQSEQCFQKIYVQDGFLGEIVDCIRSSDTLIQGCALDIVRFFISCKNNNVMDDLINEGCKNGLLIPMTHQNENASCAADYYTKLQAYQRQKMKQESVWDRLGLEWKRQNEIYGIKPKRKTRNA
ncbi:armadillo-type protein [Gorgonomyces haynaldii]|nr:armadillo-type protein [Gorgonomyces haynaldii]